MRLGLGCAVDLYWLPLGAGGHLVRICRRAYERVAAALQRRRPYDLYQPALRADVPEARYVIEQTPVPDLSGEGRGVVAEGPVGASVAGRLPLRARSRRAGAPPIGHQRARQSRLRI
jgi:hypothetical protein